MAKNKKRDEVYNIREIYMQMELDLINSMRRNLLRHRKEEANQGFKFEQWQAAKLRDLERFRRENIQIIGHYFKEVEELIKETLVETYRESQDNVNEFIKEIKNTYVDDAPTPKDETFFRTNDKKFDSLIETIEKDFNKANSAVLRRMDDIYRQTIFKTQVHLGQGSITLDKAIDRATEDFLSKGIDAITYSDGKKVNIASYAEMALRTANHRAYLMAEGKKRQEIGIPFVVVSAHATACELCVPWQGLILIDDVYSGGKKEDGPYPLLSEAMEAGLLHPNCRHNLSTYFHGITTLPKIPDADKALENYEQEQKQRGLERAIRRQKRKVAGTIDKDNLKIEKDKLKNLQEEMRNHLEENPQLRRAYRREKLQDITNKDLKAHETNIIRDSYKKVQGITTSKGTTIDYISDHFIDRSIERKVTAEEIKDALTNPLNIGKIKYNKDNKPSIEYLGEFARVQVNPDIGKLATVWRTSSKLRNKYMGDKNGKD